MTHAAPLLAIVELGGYPDFRHHYTQAGFEPLVVHTLRKALTLLRTTRPHIVIAEFIYNPMYGTRVSNLETLVAGMQRHTPQAQLIVFYEKSDHARLQQLQTHVNIPITLSFPIDEEQLKQCLQQNPR